mmetsp:Transcript_14943/g.32265  ORF Transcript_14943/g.32265 Transcript_14943/m.32265 type:complete len:243 (+) Transcript_14943:70-798(+)
MATASEMVTVCVKAGQAGRCSSSASSSSSLSPAATVTPSPSKEGSVQIPRSCLMTLQWFEAKLERWHDKESAPIVTLEIPDECDAAEGARLLHLRSLANSNASSRGDQVGPWNPVQWWRATCGKLSAFSAAIHVFHLTMLEDWAKEVAKTVAIYRLLCSESMLTIAAEMVEDACRSVSDHGNHANGNCTIEECDRCKGGTWNRKETFCKGLAFLTVGAGQAGHEVCASSVWNIAQLLDCLVC